MWYYIVATPDASYKGKSRIREYLMESLQRINKKMVCLQ